jgi:acyl carrier protein phosphodiesterase
MNFLAHFYLAGGDREALLGQFLGDFVKGDAYRRYPPRVARGIVLHRRIDAYTDGHPLVQRGLARLSPRLGWFSGIALDVFYDHLLAADWAAYSAAPLRRFVDEAYAALQAQDEWLPPDARADLARMVEHDWLFHYATLDGVAASLGRLARYLRERLPGKELRLEEGVEDLRLHREAFRGEFRAFFPDLVRHARERAAALEAAAG